MLPPWKKYPKYSYNASAWHMGDGKRCMDNWCEWFGKLSYEDKQKYISENQEPRGWEGFGIMMSK